MHTANCSKYEAEPSDSWPEIPRGLGGQSLAVALLVFAAAALTVGTGCAEKREPIDRVQPNAIKKSELTGHKWYYQRTVVDVPAANGFTFVGNTDHQGMNRIEWDIQENYLYARRTHEFIKGAAKKEKREETPGSDEFQGEVLAAYKITKHFDITQAYNQTTGEKLNIREENASDRPWYNRTHMRVDWSENLVTNYDLDFERKSIEPVPYYVQDETPNDGEPHPDAPHFSYEKQKKKKELEYFDITNKIHAEAGTITIPGYGEIPLCWLRGQETRTCGAGEYAIRNSFKKIDPNNDYVPKAYKGPETEKFGYFTTERLVYDGKEGIRQQKRKRFLNRFNLWEDWKNENGEMIPVSERTLDPIVYHVNRQYPDSLKSVAKHTAKEWNRVLTDAVEAKGYDVGDDQDVFILCPNNPVQEGDPKECGEPGTSPRIGDIRYSFMAYVPKYMEYGLLGLGPANNDPLTGEIISGMAYVYHHNDTAAHSVQEKLQLLTAPKNSEEVQNFIDGVDLTNWREEFENANVAEHGATGTPGTARRQHGLEKADHMVESLVNRPSFKQWEGRRRQITASDMREMRNEGFDEWIGPVLDEVHQREHAGVSRTPGVNGLSKYKNTYLEDQLLNSEMLLGMGRRVAGSGTSSGMTKAEKKLASPMRGGFIQEAIRRHKAKRRFAMKRNMYLPSMLDVGLQGLAREMKDKDPEKVYTKLRKTIYKSVLAHEVGHSLGLMHNFGATDDAINYQDEYWKIRDNENDPKTVGPRLSGPNTEADKITTEEINKKIHNYSYSSIMDYTGHLPIGGVGIGKYDRAAILYGYADKVEVFKNTPNSIKDWMLREWHASDGSVLTFQGGEPASVHYTTFYNEMGKSLYSDKNRMLVDTDKLVKDENGDTDWTTAKKGGETYKRVPYIYCSHSSANLSDHCLTRDYGADSYERMKHLLDDLNTWYITRSFPRGKIGVNNFSYINANYGTFSRLKSWNDIYGLYAGDIFPRFFTEEQMNSFFTDVENGWGAKTWAIQNAFNYLVQTMFMPKVGEYNGPAQRPDGTSVVRPDIGAGPNSAVQGERIGVTEGRFYSTSWNAGDRRCGYFWQECLHHMGFYLDKMMAIFALSDTETNFVARSTPEDIRQWEIGYWTTFPEQLSKINQAMLSEDWDNVAPYLAENTSDPNDNWTLKWPNYTGEMSEEHSNAVQPAATFTVKLYWQLLGQLRFPDTYDQSFVEQSRVWVTGTGNEPAVSENEKVTITDPRTGMTYAALNLGSQGASPIPQGNGPEGAGERMIQRAKSMIPYTEFCDATQSTQSTADDCICDFDESTPVRQCPNNLSKSDLARLKNRYTGNFKDYLELIKVVADVNAVRRYGSPFSP